MIYESTADPSIALGMVHSKRNKQMKLISVLRSYMFLTMIFDIRSCLQYYKTSNCDEDHVFQLQIKPALISYFYEK